MLGILSYHQPMSSSLKCPSPTSISIPWLDRWPLLHKSSERIFDRCRFSQRTISSNDPERAKFWHEPIETQNNLVRQLASNVIRSAEKRPTERWTSEVIDCKLTRRVGNSTCVLSKTRRSNLINFPMCQKAFDSRSRQPRKFSSKKSRKCYSKVNRM